MYLIGRDTKVRSFANLGFEAQPIGQKVAPKTCGGACGHLFYPCICVGEAGKHDCLHAASEDLVVHTKARARAAGLISVLSKPSSVHIYILPVLNAIFQCVCNTRSSFDAVLFLRVN